MLEKNTAQLKHDLKKADDINKFKRDNKKSFREYTLAEYLKKLLAEKNLSKAQVISDSCLGNYAYQIFDGKKKASREKILSLAFAMKLTPDETDYLLYYAEHKKLYVRNSYDAIIYFALLKGYNITKTNDILSDSKLSPLLGNFD